MSLITSYGFIINSTIQFNQNYNGGGILISTNKMITSSEITVSNVNFLNNSAHFYGGAVMFTEECENLKINFYSSNMTRNYGAESGGGIATFFQNPNVLLFFYQCIIEEN